MAGFTRIKRKIIKKLVNGHDLTLFEDLNPFEVSYQKFYCNEDMFDFSNEMFAPFKDKFPEGVYIFEIDTLGVYMNSKVTYQIKKTITAFAIEDDLGILKGTPYNIEDEN